MRDTIAMILLIAMLAFILKPEWLGETARKVVVAFQQEPQP